MKKRKSTFADYAAAALAVTVVLSVFVFGSSILNNVHLAYIRYQSQNVVTLLNSEGGGGTGWITKVKSGKYVIITNDHICKSAKGKPLVAIYKGDSYLVNIIRPYAKNDLCAVEAPKTATSGFKLASRVSYGERVFAVGHPLLEAITVTEGELSSTLNLPMLEATNALPSECSGENYRFIDLSGNPLAAAFGVTSLCFRIFRANSSTVNILPGNSGSPVLNIWGNVVAVAFAALDSGGHSYDVPLSFVKDFVSTL